MRAYIKACCTFKITAKQIQRELCDNYVSSAILIETVRRWLRKFLNGKTSVKDIDCSGRPGIQVTEANIAVEKNLWKGMLHILLGI